MDISALGRGANDSRVPSNAGLILFDGKKKPVYFNSEAVQILTYPLHLQSVKSLEKFLPEILRVILPDRASLSENVAAIEFQSGRRHYAGRVFTLDRNSNAHPRGITGLLIERSAPKAITFPAAAERFRLTKREQETVALLMVGLTSKEIASKLNVSTNTVKSFVRLIMTKMSVPTRAGIVGKLIGA
jgi:DNA-binding CsgD family transcriptional regulator